MKYKQDLQCDYCGKHIDGTPETCYCEDESCWCLVCSDRLEALKDLQDEPEEKYVNEGINKEEE